MTPEVAIRKPRVKFHFGFSRKLPHEDGLQSALKQLTCVSKMGELPPTQHTQGCVNPF